MEKTPIISFSMTTIETVTLCCANETRYVTPLAPLEKHCKKLKIVENEIHLEQFSLNDIDLFVAFCVGDGTKIPRLKTVEEQGLALAILRIAEFLGAEVIVNTFFNAIVRRIDAITNVQEMREAFGIKGDFPEEVEQEHMEECEKLLLK